MEEDTDFARECFAKVIQISVRWGGKEINFPKFASTENRRTYLGVLLGEKGTPAGLFEAMLCRGEECNGRCEEVVVQVEPRCIQPALQVMRLHGHLTLPNLGGLPGLPDAGLDGADMACTVAGTLSSCAVNPYGRLL